MAYSSLLSGACAWADRPLAAAYDHPGTAARLAVPREVAVATSAVLDLIRPTVTRRKVTRQDAGEALGTVSVTRSPRGSPCA